jgi:superfamily II DNA/RNA helicase
MIMKYQHADRAHAPRPHTSENTGRDAFAERSAPRRPRPVQEQAPAPEIPEAFAAMGLAQELLLAVGALGYTEPTPVQQQSIGLALGAEGGVGADLMVSSQTGSGKTAAFLLPTLHTILQSMADAPAQPKQKSDQRRRFAPAIPLALIVCPTRELAQQVARDAIELVRFCRGIRVASITGGTPYGAQIAQLQGASLVVATPGRLLDLESSGSIQLDQVRFLVVDEADRMLDLGFADELEAINNLTANREQTMMFSATFAPNIQRLAMRVMRDEGAHVKKIEINTAQDSHANIEQHLFWADSGQHKRKLLDHWLRSTDIEQAIVFASTQVQCDELAFDLQEAGFSAVALHGAMNQGLRNRRLKALRDGFVQILVATDVAARGIDVPSISHVFNFGLPMKAEDYTHRIGRTGRAGRQGSAVTFAEWRDERKIREIQHFTKNEIAVSTVPGLEPQSRPIPKRKGPPSRKPFGAKRPHPARRAKAY